MMKGRKIKMRMWLVILILISGTYAFIDASAQTMPLVYNVENTGADCPIPYLPSFSELRIIHPLPDPFQWADERGRMSNYSDWRLRRAEIGAQIQNYEIGPKPPRPDSITASYSDSILTVNVTVNGRTLTLTSRVILPSGTGPFPVVIGMNSPSGGVPGSIFSSRNIAEIAFLHDQVTSYGNPSNTDPYYRLYPYLNLDNSGQYSAWAWGVSRLIDGLELVQNGLPIDLKHIAVTGCSYAGKMALFAGAFDERIALTIAQESGGGGATSWRYSQTEPANSVEGIGNTNYNWFMNSMNRFSGDNVSRLPEDHHELMAMCAPRALFVTGNPDYTWLSNPSCYVASEACRQVYEAFGIPDRFGFSIVGGHMHCLVPSSQVPEIEAFVDKYMLGKDTVNTSNFSDNSYSIDLSKWITWTDPTLAKDTTYFAKLAYPSNAQAGMDTSVTLKWYRIEKAQKYLVQLSTDQSFKTIDMTDSTTTDTSVAFSGLSKNRKYYWRVRVSTSAALGPWSNIWNFITTQTAPSTAEPVSAFPSGNGYCTFTWKKVQDADQYQIQISRWPTFDNISKQAMVSDTFKIISWFSEGLEYFWHVKAVNLAGSGPWSDVPGFTFIYAPTNLVAQDSGSSGIILTWKDNSTIESGYVIERRQSTDTTFGVVDTLHGSGSEYVDKSAGQSQTYIYRVKAYNDSLESVYSNEASSNPTAVIRGRGMPAEFSLNQNYPNPFNPSTKIKFALPISAPTRLTIYDLLGREIETLVDRELSAGYYEVTFEASRLANGVYFYRIEAGKFVKTMKLLLLK